MKFFEANKTALRFEWNAASVSDWVKIRKVFVEAYVGAYQHCPLSEIGIDDDLVREAKEKNVNPLTLHFEHEYEAELARIKNQQLPNPFAINYLTVKYHDQIIALLITQLNYKSGRVYVRWNTVEPVFQHQGLGRIMLNEACHYYGNSNIELYTRKLNHSARKFYQSYGMKEIHELIFAEPTLPTTDKDTKKLASYAHQWLDNKASCDTLYPPIDDSVSDVKAFIGYCK